MSKKTKIILGVITALIVVGGAVGYSTMKNSGVEVDTAKVQSSSLAVTVMGSGKVTAINKTDVYAETQGLIDEAFVEDGDQVEAGQDLLKLDVGALQAQLAQAKAAAAQAKAGLDQANYAATSKNKAIANTQSAIKAAEKALSSAKAGQAAAQAALAQAQQALATSDPIQNPQGYLNATLQAEQAKDAVAQAASAVAQSRSALAQAKATLDQSKGTPTSGAIKAAQNGLSAANKSVELAQKAVDNAIITAPTSGVVIVSPSAASMAGGASGLAGASVSASAGSLSKGAAISPGVPILSIVDTSTLGFTTEIDETNISRVKVGQGVAIKLDAFAGKEFKGSVKKISTSAQSTLTGGNIFLVEIEIVATEGSELRLGMKGDATIEVEKVPNALSLPIEAIFSEGGSEYVYVIDADNKLVKTDIVAGTTTTQTSTEILEGVKEGDTVALAGSVAFAEGMRVTPNDAKK